VIAGFNEDEIIDFVEFAFSRSINVRFIEYSRSKIMIGKSIR